MLKSTDWQTNMENYTKMIHNVETDEITIVELTAEEQQKLASDFAKEAEALAEVVAKRTAALAKLEAIGLDADDLKALGF